MELHSTSDSTRASCSPKRCYSGEQKSLYLLDTPSIDQDVLEDKLDERVPPDIWEDYLWRKLVEGTILFRNGEYILNS